MTVPFWRLSVAPMLDWTDRHCRALHRALSRRTLLYTEMVVAEAVLHGGPARLYRRGCDGPVALQLGGSAPERLAQAVRLARDFRYDEINLNVGCPSDRVQGGAFGACLMREPALVADCVRAMIEAAGDEEITVKCRIGVDEQAPRVVLPDFLERMQAAGVRRVVVHARKAWLKGLSPKDNRTIPPLDHPLVEKMAHDFPRLTIIANGEIDSLDAACEKVSAGLGGAMIGRAAYHAPADILGAADRVVYGESGPDRSGADAVRAMLPYIEGELARGEALPRITRPMLDLFAGRPGARRWRRAMSEEARAPGAGPALVEAALARIEAG